MAQKKNVTITVRSRLFINIVLFLAVLFLAFFLSRNTNDNENTNIKLTTINPVSVEQIQIIRRDLDEITFIKKNGQWIMQTPYLIAANKIRINTMLKLLGAHSYTRLNESEVELERFLLDDPVVSIKFNDALISFGDTSPLDKHRYVLFDNSVHLINDSLYQQLLTSATFFISPNLLPPDSKIEALHLPGREILKVDGKWTIEPDMNISADKVIEVLDAWQDVAAVTVRTYEETEVLNRINVDLGNSEIIKYLVISDAPKLILARPDLGIQYHISNYEAERLFLPGSKAPENIEESADTDVTEKNNI